MLTLSPETLTVAQHLGALRRDSDDLITTLTTLVATLSDHPTDAPLTVGRSTWAEIQAIRHILNRLRDMLRQANREHTRGDPAKALATCDAATAILANELPTRLRAWANVEPNTDTRTHLREWIASLESIQETPC